MRRRERIRAAACPKFLNGGEKQPVRPSERLSPAFADTTPEYAALFS
jgi:hypothetical protein